MAARFWVGGDGTWDNTATTHWSTTSGGASGSAAPTSSDTVTFDGNSGAGTGLGGGALITAGANVTAQTVALGSTGGQFVGSLDMSTFSPTFLQFAFTGTGTRGLLLGSGTWALNSVGNVNVWDITTATGLTLTKGTATLNFASASTSNRIFQGGGKAYPTVNVSNSGAGRGTFRFATSALTFDNLTLTGPLRCQFDESQTYTITNAFTWAGTNSSNVLFIHSGQGANNTQATISVASGTCSVAWAAFAGIAVTGGATFNATNSFDGGGNSGFASIAGPSGGGGMISG